MEIVVNNEEETARVARELSKTLKKGDVLCLSGTLGAGKTVFVREIIRFLLENAYEEVPSPTFTLVQTYETPNFPVFHYDLYRLEAPEEIYELGWEDSLSVGVCLIEWPERAGSLLPFVRKDITLQTIENSPGARKIIIKDMS